MTLCCRIWKVLAVAVLSAAFLVSCDKGGGESGEAIAVSIKAPSADASASSQFVDLTVSDDWTLSVADGSGKPVEWAWLSPYDSSDQLSEMTGTASSRTVVLHWAVNTDTGNRVCKLTLRSGSQSAEATFIQEGATIQPITPTELRSDPVGKWMEMPAFAAGGGKYFITHDMKVSGEIVRNYEYCYDSDNLVALWVAYPLNRTLIDGTSGRSDQWGLDPKVPRKFQPVLVNRSYRDNDDPSMWSGYDRGHQLPSADRYNKSDSNAANISTFYGVNITPQNHDLNTGVWASLEDRVRSWSSQLDTLYVVTGCVVGSNPAKVKDDDFKQISVPSGYFKALLGYAGASAAKRTAFSSYESNGYYLGIAYWFDNKAGGDLSKNAMTIDQLEARTGLDFFVNLPQDISAKVEADTDKWWSKN